MNNIAPITRGDLALQAQGKPPRPGSQATTVEQSRAIAEVQAAIVVAQQCPRNEAQALAAVDDTCGMMEVAEHAFFKFNRGGENITGPSIHLAVELARLWGNIKYGIRELARDDEAGRSEMLAYAWDVQTNTRAETTFIVMHMRDKKGGPVKLKEQRDIYENNANAGARRQREMIFRVLPPYLIERAISRCRKTLEGGGGTPLPQQRADVIAAFAKKGVQQNRIEGKHGPADTWTEVDIAQLRISYRSIDRGEVSANEEFPPEQSRITAQELAAQAMSRVEGDDPPPSPAAPAATVTIVEDDDEAPLTADERQFIDGNAKFVREECKTVAELDEFARQMKLIEPPSTRAMQALNAVIIERKQRLGVK